jgi:hypothetical protein
MQAETENDNGRAAPPRDGRMQLLSTLIIRYHTRGILPSTSIILSRCQAISGPRDILGASVKQAARLL